MIRTKTTLNLSIYPAEIITFLASADIYDSSCSEEARVYFSDKDQGYFLKEAAAGFLKPEYLIYLQYHPNFRYLQSPGHPCLRRA